MWDVEGWRSRSINWWSSVIVFIIAEVIAGLGHGFSEETMMHVHIRLAADVDAWEDVLPVDEEVEGVDYGAIGGVFEGDDAVGHGG